MDLLEKLKLLISEAAELYPSEVEAIAEHLVSNGVTVREWIPADKPPEEYRNEYGELIPFLVCELWTEYPFRAMYDGKTWGDGFFDVPVTHWMPLPEPPKGN